MAATTIELTRFRNAEIPPRDEPLPAQVYPQLTQLATAASSQRIFTFPFPPVGVQHSNMTPEWVEVDRPGYVPIVGLKRYNLMRIQFDFLVAAPWDGISYSVENELILLRQMVSSRQPVYFTGMGTFLSTPQSQPGTGQRSGVFFRITDFTVNSLRRNTEQKITAAQCSMSMQEDYLLNITAIRMPAIQYPPILKPRVSTSPSPSTTLEPRCTSEEARTGNCYIVDGVKVYVPFYFTGP